MGHLRLGRLPKTRQWNAVIALLDDHGDVPAVASGVVQASDNYLSSQRTDSAVTYCFWLLTRVAWASRSDKFISELGDLGIDVESGNSVLAFVTQLTDTVKIAYSQTQTQAPLSDIAVLALRRALIETVGQYTSNFLASDVEDLQQAIRVYSTREQFGVLARRFFADYLSRTLRYFLDKELSNHVGEKCHLTDVTDTKDFVESLDLYARQSARIVEEFAGGWYSKRNWESKGQISREEAQGFVAVALRKLRMELKLEGAPQ